MSSAEAIARLRAAMGRADEGRVIVGVADLRTLFLAYKRLYAKALALWLENEALGRVLGPAVYGRAAKVRLQAAREKAQYEAVLMLAREMKRQDSRGRYTEKQRARTATEPASSTGASPGNVAVDGSGNTIDDEGDE